MAQGHAAMEAAMLATMGAAEAIVQGWSGGKNP